MTCNCRLRHCCQKLCDSGSVFIKDYDNYNIGLTISDSEYDTEEPCDFCPFCGVKWTRLG